MIPWIESHTIQLGPITLQTWGTLVATGYLVGTVVAARKAKERGLDPKVIWDLAFWLFIAAFVGSRLFHVLFYQPGYYLQHPLEAFDPRRPGYAIFGGFAACGLVFWAYVRKKKLDFMAYADTLAWGIPWGCGIGRIGCFLIHDHPGTLSDFALAVKYPDGHSRHDLGLYLSITGFTIGVLFLILARKPRGPGFWFGMLMALDGIARLWLDFYRTVDIRYFGLTPTQWATFPLIATGVWLVWQSRGKKLEARS